MSDRDNSNSIQILGVGEKYSIQRQLASKGGRKTLLARDLQTQELVVIKLLSFNHDFTWDDLKLFEQSNEQLSTSP
jgi:hypothetical protein